MSRMTDTSIVCYGPLCGGTEGLFRISVVGLQPDLSCCRASCPRYTGTAYIINPSISAPDQRATTRWRSMLPSTPLSVVEPPSRFCRVVVFSTEVDGEQTCWVPVHVHARRWVPVFGVVSAVAEPIVAPDNCFSVAIRDLASHHFTTLIALPPMCGRLLAASREHRTLGRVLGLPFHR